LYEALQSHRRNAEKELVKMAKTQALKAAAGQGEGLRSKFSVSWLPRVYAACNFHNTCTVGETNIFYLSVVGMSCG